MCLFLKYNAKVQPKGAKSQVIMKKKSLRVFWLYDKILRACTPLSIKIFILERQKIIVLFFAEVANQNFFSDEPKSA